MTEMFDRVFQLKDSGTTVLRESRAGMTIFLTMAYILLVNPLILSNAIKVEGADIFPQLLTATAVAACVGTLIMGLWAKHPFALAPGMGLNAYFVAVVNSSDALTWQTALGAVFLSGVAFLGLSIAGIRTQVMRAIPMELRGATAAGVGLFLALIGAQNAGWIVDNPFTLVSLGSFGEPGAQIALLGLVITAVLASLRIEGALLIGILSGTLAAMVSGANVYGGKAFGGFQGKFFGVMDFPVWPADLFMAMDIVGALNVGLIALVFTFAFVDLFDTAGTLVGLADRAGYSDEDGLPRASRAFTADAIATMVGAMLGTSTTTTYIESASGIQAGGRTGLTSVVVALLFLVSLVLWPIAYAVPAAATAPALVLIGVGMMGTLGRVSWNVPHKGLPVFLTVLGMPLTYSIGNGISFGLISWTVLHLLTGRGRQVHPFLYGITVLLIFRFAWLGGA